MNPARKESGFSLGLGVGFGTDCRAAASAAAEQALAACEKPQLLLAALAYEGKDEAALRGLSETAGSTTVVAAQAYGCGAFSGSKYVGANSIVAAALGGARVKVSCAAVEHVTADMQGAGAKLGAELAAAAPAAILLFADASISHSGRDIRDYTFALRSGLPPAVPAIGGNAQNGRDSGCVYINGRRLECGAAGIALGGGINAGLGAAHNFRELAGPLPVSRAEGPKVLELAGRPVGQLFPKLIGEPPEKVTGDIGHAVRHPFAIQVGSRNIIRLQRELLADGSFAGLPHPLKQGELVHIMRHHKEELLSSARACAEEALADLGCRPAAAFVFPCIGRWGLGGNPAGELRTLRKAFGAQVPIFGLYSAGEYYTTQWRSAEAQLHYLQISICAMALGC